MRVGALGPTPFEAMVEGILLNDAGAGVAGATVDVAVRGSKGAGRPAATVVTTSDGTFRFQRPFMRGRLAPTSSLEFVVNGASVPATAADFVRVVLQLANAVTAGAPGQETHGSAMAKAGRHGSAWLDDTAMPVASRPGLAERQAGREVPDELPLLGHVVARSMSQSPMVAWGRGRPGPRATSIAHARGGDGTQAPNATSAVDWLRRYLTATALSLPNVSAEVHDLGVNRR